jgi:hypothetical protein
MAMQQIDKLRVNGKELTIQDMRRFIKQDLDACLGFLFSIKGDEVMIDLIAQKMVERFKQKEKVDEELKALKIDQ